MLRHLPREGAFFSSVADQLQAQEREAASVRHMSVEQKVDRLFGGAFKIPKKG